MTRNLIKAVGTAQTLSDLLPPTFLLPLRQRLSTVSTTATTTDPAPPPGAYTPTKLSPTPNYSIPPEAQPSLSDVHQARRHPQLSRHSPLPPPTKPLSSSIQLLTSLAAQLPHYMTAHVHARPYLVTVGDTIRLPFHMPHAPPGTVVRLNRARMLGSRDFTFQGDPWIDDKFFICRAVVVGIESEPMRVKEKTKRRQRKVKTVKSKMRYTILRVMELKVLPEGQGEEMTESREEDGAVDKL